VVVLASGDPMLSGVGASLVRLHGAGAVEVVPHPSSVTLACARLGWAVERRRWSPSWAARSSWLRRTPPPGGGCWCSGSDGGTPAQVAAAAGRPRLRRQPARRAGAAGRPDERRSPAPPPTGRTPAPTRWWSPPSSASPTRGTVPLPTVPGLPDDAYESDGQLTKREVRAVTLSRLAPCPGSCCGTSAPAPGSIGIEWMRAHPDLPRRRRRGLGRARRADRPQRRAARRPRPAGGARAARRVLSRLRRAGRVFVGGGLTSAAGSTPAGTAPPGGRLVANAVTVEGEAVWHVARGRWVASWCAGVRARAGRVFTGWKPAHARDDLVGDGETAAWTPCTCAG
jgi:precorrin-6Y C5,15-methyltransferase (decarboxylating)